MPVTSTPDHPKTHYEILDLSAETLDTAARRGESIQPIVKRAYRRALLRHHPDKTSTGAPSAPNIGTITVDLISQAFAVLSDPQRRADYDRILRLTETKSGPNSTGPTVSSGFQTGIETVDLDDLEYVESAQGTGQWWRSCRCGNARGYAFGEADLEEAAQFGELMVGCADCSLWLRVCFAVVDDDDDDGKREKEGSEADVKAGSEEPGLGEGRVR